MPARRRDPQRYAWPHRRTRLHLAPLVASGSVRCTRCGELIAPGEAWDLDHDDVDGRRYRGAAHARCNRQTGLHYAERKVSRQWL